MGPSALVSIVIPAYKPTFFEAALRSAFAQDYPSIEIVIGDDCPTDAVQAIVERLRPYSPWPIDYVRNSVQRGEAGNVTEGVRRARGTYIKFLYDDDLLMPSCVRRQVETMEAYPGLAMVTARRQLVNEQDQLLPDTYATRFPFAESTRVQGADLTSFLGEYTYNFIGEPTSVLCRRADVLAFGEGIFSLDGQAISWVGDLAIYVKLLRQGDLAMLDECLSSFRVSVHQSSQGGRDDHSGPRAFHQLFRELLHKLGWVRPAQDNAHVRVGPLAHKTTAEQGAPVDLRAWLHEVLPGFAQPEYKHWLHARKLGPARQARVDAQAQAQGAPAVLVVINDLGNDERRLLHSLASLDRQAPMLANTTVVVLSSRPNVGSGRVEDRLYWVSSDHAQRAGHLNQLVDELAFDWMISLNAGTRFNTDALTVTWLELMNNPACPAIFCDQVYHDGHGGLWPLLRGNFNLDQFLSAPAAMAGHWLLRRDALLAMDGFDGSVPAALEFDLALRLIEAGQLGFGHISEPLVTCEALPLQPCEDERQALLAHLQRRGYAQAHVQEASPRQYLLDYGHLAHGQAMPSVAVLIAVEGPLDRLKRCVTSLRVLGGYAQAQVVLVETQGTDRQAGAWMDELARQAPDQVLSVRSPRPLTRNTALNGAVEALNHEYLVLLDPACVLVEAQWIELLLDQAMRPEVGAVAARRIERGERLQDAGIRLGLRGPAGTALLTRQEGPVYLQVQRNAVALPGACLMVARAIFRQVGGLDAQRFQQRWADTDLCLKLHWAGYLNVWTPRAWVAMTEPVHQAEAMATTAADTQAMYAQWGASLGRDPYASHLLALTGNGFDFDPDAQILWRPLAFAGLPVVIGAGHPGAADPRIGQPLQALRAAGLLEGGLVPDAPGVNEWLRLVPGAVVLPFGLEPQDDGLNAVDDQLVPCRLCDLALAGDSALERRPLAEALAGFDKVLVATTTQAERLGHAHPRIEVLPPALPPALWQGLDVAAASEGLFRVGLVCEALDTLDLPLLTRLLERFAGRVQWVVYGRLPEAWRPWVDEFHPAVAPHRYPQTLASLGLHAAVVAPSAAFRASALAEQRVLEHGACGAAVVSTQPSAWPVSAAGASLEGLRAAIEAWLSDPAQRQADAAALRQQVLARGLLEGEQAQRWLAAWAPLIA
jgi:GT2 family glycosyltransferase